MWRCALWFKPSTMQGQQISSAWRDSGSGVTVQRSELKTRRSPVRLGGFTATETATATAALGAPGEGRLGHGGTAHPRGECKTEAGGYIRDQDARPEPRTLRHPEGQDKAAGVRGGPGPPPTPLEQRAPWLRGFILTLSMEWSFQEAMNVTLSKTPRYPVLLFLKVPTARSTEHVIMRYKNYSAKHYRFRN